MSKKTPDGNNSLGSIKLDSELGQKIQQVKKSVRFGFLKLITSAAILAAAAWLSNSPYIAGAPAFLKNALMPVSILLALFVFMLGNFRRLIKYIFDSTEELKKVVWPSKAYTIRMTGFVIVFISLLTIFLYGVDALISWLFFDIIMKRG
ncbi:MAG: preprotein translocase subunit SecE [Neisseria sp.]|nr:preprotein translocase subunit SecE [Neisseria sp.]